MMQVPEKRATRKKLLKREKLMKKIIVIVPLVMRLRGAAAAPVALDSSQVPRSMAKFSVCAKKAHLQTANCLLIVEMREVNTSSMKKMTLWREARKKIS
jgi:hypothetical protein